MDGWMDGRTDRCKIGVMYGKHKFAGKMNGWMDGSENLYKK
jgi:hypothetical protein